MDLIDPGLMSDYQLLSHVQRTHGPIPGLTETPEAMTESVMRRVRDMHDREHLRSNHKHWHNYVVLEDNVAEQMDGVYFREGTDGLDQRTNIWLAHCNKPNCYFGLAGYDESSVRARYDNHTCPQENGVTHYGASVTISLIEQCWQKADLLYDKLQNLEDQTTNEAMYLKHELRGMCKVLAVFVSPFFKSVNEVATEVSKRYNMCEAEQPYETPGTQTRIFDVPKQDTAEESLTERAGKVLTEAEQKAIRFAADSGMFTVPQLAKTYDISEAVVQHLIDSKPATV